MEAKTVEPKPAQTFSPREWVRLILVYLLIPLTLLLSGGDLGWWQGWVYSLLIFAAGIGGRIAAERRDGFVQSFVHPLLAEAAALGLDRAELTRLIDTETGKP